MKRILLMALPAMVFAQTYYKIIEDIDGALSLQSAQQLEKAAISAAEAAKGRNLPTADLGFDAAWLKDTPTVTFRIPGSPPTEVPMGTKRNFVGFFRLAYPLFTGYAITAAIDRAKLEREKAGLEVLDLKRNLYLQATRLSSACYASDRTLLALAEGKKAMDDAYKKAKALYENGLLPPSDLYNIEAKRYEVEAQIIETRSEKRQILNRLSYLLNKSVDSVELPLQDVVPIPLDKETLIEKALSYREDIKALESALEITQTVKDLAKSRFYPTIALAAELKRRGNTPELNGDGFTNPDQSYIGASAKWNIFNGFSDKKMLEAARMKQLASAIALNDYKNRVKTELENAFLQLESLISRLKSAKMQLKAAKAYCELTRGRFDNQLASADELSRSIADLSAIEAEISVLESHIFNQKIAIRLMAGIESFQRAFFSNAHEK